MPNLLRCPGIGRDKDNAKALQLYFNRPVTDDEMKALHEFIRRALLENPQDTPARLAQ